MPEEFIHLHKPRHRNDFKVLLLALPVFVFIAIIAFVLGHTKKQELAASKEAPSVLGKQEIWKKPRE